MAVVVDAETCDAAWLAATGLLLESGPQNSLLVVINSPWPCDRVILERYNPRGVKASIRASAADVANTIFPMRYLDRGWTRAKVYGRYLAANVRGLRRHHSWGTYFERMISFGPERVNRLEEIIVALRTWQGRHQASLALHLSAQGIDALRTRGGPCLQYLQFSDRRDGLHLIALVRNHDYFEKALGNFAGLSYLLRFVSRSARRTIGSVTCHSIHAYSSGTKSLLERLRAS